MRSFSLAKVLFLLVVVLLSHNLQAQVENWEQLPLYGGFITSLVMDSEDNIIAATNANGFYASGDDGETWTHGGLLNKNLVGMAIDGEDKMYAFTTVEFFCKDADAAEWDTLTAGLYSYSMMFIDGETVYVAGMIANGQGLKATTDFENWEQVHRVPAGMTIHQMAKHGDDLFAASYVGIDRKLADAEEFENVYEGRTKGVVIDSEGTIYIINENVGVLKSTDNGDNWAETALDASMSNRVYNIAVDDNDVVYCTRGDNIYKTEDGGDNWTEHMFDIGNLFVMPSLLVDSANDVVYVGGPKGVYRSGDFENWEMSNNGILGYSIEAVGFTTGGEIMLGGWIPSDPYFSHVFRTSDGGEQWSCNAAQEVGFLGLVNDIDEGADGVLFAATDDGFKRSTDGGDSFSVVAVGNHPFKKKILVHPDGDIFVGLVNSPVYRSTDNGENFSATGDGPLWVNAMTYGANGDIFAGSTSGTNGIYRSSDLGDNWEQVNEGLEAYLAISSLAANQNNGNLYAGTAGGGIYRSTDNGDNWEVINEGLPQGMFTPTLDVQSIVLNSEGHIVISFDFGLVGYGGYSGVYISTDNGDNWSDIGGAIPFKITDLAFNDEDNLLVGASNGAYLVTEFNSVENNLVRRLPESHILLESYPNPFNAQTNIMFEQQKAGRIDLSLFTLEGKKLRTVFSGMSAAGQHAFNLNGEGLPTGTYMLRLQDGQGQLIASEMIVLLK